jgi:MFS family permease
MMSPLAGLAALNFFSADVQGGLGPFLATWLAASVHWTPERIGLVMTISGIAGLVFNGPAGALVDREGRPRWFIVLATLAIAAGTLVTPLAQGFIAVIAAQIASAAGGALMLPALTALTLGLVGKDSFPGQQGRNQAWNHAGNVAAALLIVGATYVLGAASAFWVLAGMAIASVLTLLAIPASAIDDQRIRGDAALADNTSLVGVLSDRRLLILSLALLLFHLGNAAMLPLLGQRMAALGNGDPTRWMGACIIVAQLTMVPVAIGTGWAADHGYRAWLLPGACAVLLVRGLIAAMALTPIWLVPVQMLDACGAGTIGVAVPILVTDFTWGSGRTQTALGATATFQGIGAALSTSFGGVLATQFGWTVAFFGLALPAVAALALSLVLVGQASRLKAAAIKARV